MAEVDEMNLIEIFTNRLSAEQKRSLDKEDLCGNTPLVYALKKNWLNLALHLLQGGFYREDRVNEYTLISPLHQAAVVQDDLFLAQIVSAFRIKVREKDFQGNTPLHYAAWKRNKKYCEILLDEGADINDKNDLGYTPLHLACASNNPKFDHSSKLEEMLLKRGADIEAEDNNGETPLMTLFKLDGQDEVIPPGSKYDPITTLITLLNAKADIHKKSKSKRTPLHYACIRGATISALTLINNGAD